jgi:hypothetical protein
VPVLQLLLLKLQLQQLPLRCPVSLLRQLRHLVKGLLQLLDVLLVPLLLQVQLLLVLQQQLLLVRQLLSLLLALSF